jgi:hypothetical protein
MNDDWQPAGTGQQGENQCVEGGDLRGGRDGMGEARGRNAEPATSLWRLSTFPVAKVRAALREKWAITWLCSEECGSRFTAFNGLVIKLL